MSTTSRTDSKSAPGNAGSGAPRTLVLVHGRGWKPDAGSLASLWRRALVRGLERLPGFRNVLVHDYVALDLGRVIEALDDLEPVERFLQAARCAVADG